MIILGGMRIAVPPTLMAYRMPEKDSLVRFYVCLVFVCLLFSFLLSLIITYILIFKKMLSKDVKAISQCQFPICLSALMLQGKTSPSGVHPPHTCMG